MAHTDISNNKRKTNKKQKLGLLRRNGVAGLKISGTDQAETPVAKRKMVSTLTHSTREVANHFLQWREKLTKSMIGHNGGPK